MAYRAIHYPDKRDRVVRRQVYEKIVMGELERALTNNGWTKEQVEHLKSRYDTSWKATLDLACLKDWMRRKGAEKEGEPQIMWIDKVRPTDVEQIERDISEQLLADRQGEIEQQMKKKEGSDGK
jgi:hypothetical protein